MGRQVAASVVLDRFAVGSWLGVSESLLQVLACSSSTSNSDKRHGVGFVYSVITSFQTEKSFKWHPNLKAWEIALPLQDLLWQMTSC